MIKVHIGPKGVGKTKKLIDAVNSSLKDEKGDVVCITNGTRLIHDIDRGVRLINTESFNIADFTMFSGFICGILSQDFDITHIFIDSIFKIVPNADISNIDQFISILETIEKQFDVSFTIMISTDENNATPGIKKYIA